MKKYFAIPIISFCFFLQNGNANPDSIQAAAFHKKMIAHIMNESAADSIRFYKNAAFDLFKKNADLKNAILVFRRAGQRMAYSKRRYEDAIKIYLEGLERCAEMRPPQNDDEWHTIGLYHADMGYVYGNGIGDYRKAKKRYEKAKEIFENELGYFDDQKVATYTYLPLANIYTRYGDFNKAQTLLSKTVEVNVRDKVWQKAVEAYSDLARSYEAAGNIQMAISTLEEGRKIKQARPLSKSFIEFFLAGYYLETNELEKAEQQLKRLTNIVNAIEDSIIQAKQFCELESLRAEIFFCKKTMERSGNIFKVQSPKIY